MKRLNEFILENTIKENNSNDLKTFEFNFTDINNSDDIIEYLKEKENYISGEDKLFTLTITSENYQDDELKELIDKLDEFISNARNDNQNSANEQYAQKTHKLKDSIDDVKEYIDSLKDEGSSDEGSSDEGSNDK